MFEGCEAAWIQEKGKDNRYLELPASMISQIHYINMKSLVNLDSFLTKLCTQGIDVMFSTSEIKVAC